MADLERAFSTLDRDRPDGLLVRAGGVAIGSAAATIIEFAAAHRIPAHYGNALNVSMGGLMSYSVDFRAMRPRLVSFIDRIFKGANPGDLPIEEPTHFRLIINLKTAKALGLSLPQSLLALADEVIQ